MVLLELFYLYLQNFTSDQLEALKSWISQNMGILQKRITIHRICISGKYEVSCRLPLFSTKCSIHHKSVAPKCIRGNSFLSITIAVSFEIPLSDRRPVDQLLNYCISEWRSMYFNITSPSRRSSKRRASMRKVEPYSKCQVM